MGLGVGVGFVLVVVFASAVVRECDRHHGDSPCWVVWVGLECWVGQWALLGDALVVCVGLSPLPLGLRRWVHGGDFVLIGVSWCVFCFLAGFGGRGVV